MTGSYSSIKACVLVAIQLVCLTVVDGVAADDMLARMQQEASAAGSAVWGHWGPEASRYRSWSNHSNRLVPVYLFGGKLDKIRGVNSAYRDADKLEKLYGRLPEGTLNSRADYFDQTQLYDLQQQYIRAGKKYIFVVLFDGMDWQITQATAAYVSGEAYYDGKGAGLLFQDYDGANDDYGFMVCSAYEAEPRIIDVNAQHIVERQYAVGGYDFRRGGDTPWFTPDPSYLIGKSRDRPHIVTDSASSASSICSGIKTFNESINVDNRGGQSEPIARQLQAKGFGVGIVTSVPISHATVGAAYANNVSRSDYQDISRDLLGLPSVSHRRESLSGVDVLIGAGWGEQAATDPAQGANYVPGNKYLAPGDDLAADIEYGGKYRFVQRQPRQVGASLLQDAAEKAARGKERLLGFFGVQKGHLPFRTGDGNYNPVREKYTLADVEENPTLAEMTSAALTVLEQHDRGFWMMVEAGDVDWASHSTNIDDAIGAVISGDEAFARIVNWIEMRNAWRDSLVIVTADHGHLFTPRDLKTFSNAR